MFFPLAVDFVMAYWNAIKDVISKQLKQSDCSMLLHSYLNVHDYIPISKDTVSISVGKSILGPVCKQLFHVFPKRG